MAIYFDWIISILYSYVQFHFGTLHTLHYKLNKNNVGQIGCQLWKLIQIPDELNLVIRQGLAGIIPLTRQLIFFIRSPRLRLLKTLSKQKLFLSLPGPSGGDFCGMPQDSTAFWLKCGSVTNTNLKLQIKKMNALSGSDSLSLHNVLLKCR